ncbi:hypothetical protein [Pararhodobacter sp.]|uniref:hypothetical protein n=1 Tax=Pararhodobacter sp. TaxID=2127056 RepID=UPI002AFF9553|nr:hypothetical protein [Pararhodobacter sp.]
MISAPSGSLAISSATLACSARLYSTTGGQALGGASKPAFAQPINQLAPITRTASGCVQHLAVDGIGTLQHVDPLGGTACALAHTAEIEKEEDDRERSESDCRYPKRPWPGEDTGQ